MTTRTPRESVGYGGELRDTGRAPWYGSCAGVSRARVRRTVRKEGPPARAAPEVPAGGLGDGVGGGGETPAAGARGDAVPAGGWLSIVRLADARLLPGDWLGASARRPPKPTRVGMATTTPRATVAAIVSERPWGRPVPSIGAEYHMRLPVSTGCRPVRREQGRYLALPAVAFSGRPGTPRAQVRGGRGLESEDRAEGVGDGGWVGRIAHGPQRSVGIVDHDPPSLREVGRHDRNAGGQALEQLVGRGQPFVERARLVDHDRDVGRGHPLEQLGRRHGRQEVHPAGERRGFRQAAQAVLLLAPSEQCQVGGFQTGLGHGPDRLGQAPIGQEAAVVQDQGVPGGQAQRAPQPLGTLRRRLLAGRTVAHDDGPWQPEPLVEKAGQGGVDCHEGISAPRKATFEPSNIALGPTLLARHSAGLGEVLVAVVYEAPAELAPGETRRSNASQIVAVVDFGTSAGEGRGP